MTQPNSDDGDHFIGRPDPVESRIGWTPLGSEYDIRTEAVLLNVKEGPDGSIEITAEPLGTFELAPLGFTPDGKTIRFSVVPA